MLNKNHRGLSIFSSVLVASAAAFGALGCEASQSGGGPAGQPSGTPAFEVQDGGTTAPAPSPSPSPAASPLRAVGMSIVTHEGRPRQEPVSVGTGFVTIDNAAPGGRIVRREASGAEVVFERLATETLTNTSMARDPKSERIGGIASRMASPTVFLYDDAGHLRWSLPLSAGPEVTLGEAAVHGEEVIVTGRTDAVAEIGCPQAAKGQFIAWFASGTCRQLTNVITPAAPTVAYESTLVARDLAVAPDGSVAIGGWFKYSLEASGRALPAAGEAGSSFVAVFEPSGELRWVKVTSTASGDDVWSVAFDADGAALIIAGGQKSEGPLGLGEGARSSGAGRSFAVALGARDGGAKWARRFGNGSGAEIRTVDGQGRAIVVVTACDDVAADTERLTSGPAAPSSDTCVGAVDVKTGSRLFMKRIGPGVESTVATADDAGFWLTAEYSGRPDVGFGPLLEGKAFFARYEYR